MMRVLVAETPEVDPEWLQEHGVSGLLSSLSAHASRRPHRRWQPEREPAANASLPGEHARLVFVRARASGAEAVCRVRKGVTEPAGECRVFGSEEEAVWSVSQGEVGESAMLVVGGCGPRGAPDSSGSMR